jgi:hypothetical protein
VGSSLLHAAEIGIDLQLLTPYAFLHILKIKRLGKDLVIIMSDIFKMQCDIR